MFSVGSDASRSTAGPANRKARSTAVAKIGLDRLCTWLATQTSFRELMKQVKEAFALTACPGGNETDGFHRVLFFFPSHSLSFDGVANGRTIYTAALQASITADTFCLSGGAKAKTDAKRDDANVQDDGDDDDDDDEGGSGSTANTTGMSESALLRTHVAAFQHLSDGIAHGDFRWKSGGPLVPKTANKTTKPCLFPDYKAFVKNPIHVDITCSSQKLAHFITKARELSRNKEYLESCGIMENEDSMEKWLRTHKNKAGAPTPKSKLDAFHKGYNSSCTLFLLVTHIPVNRA